MSGHFCLFSTLWTKFAHLSPKRWSFVYGEFKMWKREGLEQLLDFWNNFWTAVKLNSGPSRITSLEYKHCQAEALWTKVFLAFTESIIHKIRSSCPQTCVLESLNFKFADPIALKCPEHGEHKGERYIWCLQKKYWSEENSFLRHTLTPLCGFFWLQYVHLAIWQIPFHLGVVSKCNSLYIFIKCALT